MSHSKKISVSEREFFLALSLWLSLSLALSLALSSPLPGSLSGFLSGSLSGYLSLALWFSLAPIPDGRIVQLLVACLTP